MTRDALRPWSWNARHRRHFVWNILLGLCIALLCHVLEGTPWGEGVQNAMVLDRLTRMVYADAGSPRTDLQFVCIGPNTRDSLGQPRTMPRSVLAQLIRQAARWPLKVLVVDVSMAVDRNALQKEASALARVRDITGSVDPGLSEAIEATLHGDLVLAQAMREALQGNPGMFIVVSTLSQEGASGGTSTVALDLKGHLPPELRCRLLTASCYMEPSVAGAADSLVRHWEPLDLRAFKGSPPQDRWHVALVAAAAAASDPETYVRETMEGTMNPTTPLGQLHQAGSQYIASGYKRMPTGVLELSDEGRKDRGIPFSIPDPNDKDMLHQRIRFTIGAVLHGAAMSAPKGLDANYHEASDLLQPDWRPGNEPGQGPSRIICMLGDLTQTEDWHPTPVGIMPGLYILGNAIDTVCHGPHLAPANPWIALGIEGMAILLAAYLFLVFSSIWAQAIASMALLLTGVPLACWYWMDSGIYVNVLFPVLGMFIHKGIEDFREIWHSSSVSVVPSPVPEPPPLSSGVPAAGTGAIPPRHEGLIPLDSASSQTLAPGRASSASHSRLPRGRRLVL